MTTCSRRPPGIATVNSQRPQPILAPAVKRANEALADQEGELIEHVTPHSLRRTFISLLLAGGAEVPYVMAQAGHDDPKVTLAIYAE